MYKHHKVINTIPDNHRVHLAGNTGPNDNVLVRTKGGDDCRDCFVYTEVLSHNFQGFLRIRPDKIDIGPLVCILLTYRMNLFVSADFCNNSLYSFSMSVSMDLPRWRKTTAAAWHAARDTWDLKFFTDFSRTLRVVLMSCSKT